jgi:F0F1-type ATP synthase assembly protein I
MSRFSKPQPDSNRAFLMRYAGLASQLLAAIGIGVFLGMKADGWLHTAPLFSALLPLLILVALFYKIYRETSHKSDENN